MEGWMDARQQHRHSIGWANKPQKAILGVRSVFLVFNNNVKHGAKIQQNKSWFIGLAL